MKVYWIKEETIFPAMPIEEEIKLFKTMRFWRYTSFILLLFLVLLIVFK